MAFAPLNKLKRREKVLACLLVLAVLGILYHNNVYRSTSQKKQSLSRKLKKIESIISEERAKLPAVKEIDISRLDSMKQKYNEGIKEFDALEGKLLDKDEIATFIRKITSIAKKNNIDVVYVKASPPIEEEDLTVLPLKISFISNYHNILAYIKFLNSLSDFIKIEDIQIEAQKEILPNLNNTISMNILLSREKGATFDTIIRDREPYFRDIISAKKIKDPTSPPKRKLAEDKGEKAAEEIAKLTLTGILKTKGKRSALINGQLLQKGDEILGYTIKSIKRKSVILTDKDGDRYILKVKSSSEAKE